MRTAQLLKRNLVYFWRANLAVVLGVAAAVSVLAGALLVGDSVRGSLRDLFLQRLGNTDSVITSTGFFREQLAVDLHNHDQFASAGFVAAAPLIALEGTVTHEASGRLASSVRVYGVDERFWTFHGRDNRAPVSREILVSHALAQELASAPDDALLLRVQKPSEIPAESLHSRKEDLGSTLRLTMREALASEALGEFSVQPQQGSVRAVFIPLAALQKELGQPGKVNLILIAENHSAVQQSAAKEEALGQIVKAKATLEDYGVTLRSLDTFKSISVETDSKILNDPLAEAATTAGNDLSMHAVPVFSYLANMISSGQRAIPYSIVTAIDENIFADLVAKEPSDRVSMSTPPENATPIVLNEWAARDLGVSRGASISLEYYYWHGDGRLETRTADFYLAAVVPISGIAADRDLVPEYPGISGSEHLADWDPPFPVELSRIRQQDEDYWDQYRTTPKAFIPLAAGQKLWQTRFGKLTSLRLAPQEGASIEKSIESYQQQLLTSLDPTRMGFATLPVRQEGLEASRGATDFGEYFLYFSFFLVVSALLLTALFFKLGVEQRLREIGTLQAIGFPASQVRKLFLAEGVILSIIGSAVGLFGAIVYGYLMMKGLSTWWVNAVGTTMLKLHVSPVSLLLGAIGGVVAAVVCIVWTLRRVAKESTRSLIMGVLAGSARTVRRGEKVTEGNVEVGKKSPRRRVTASARLVVAITLTILGLSLLMASSVRFIDQTAGFFCSGLLLLAALLCYQSVWLRRNRGKAINGSGWWPVARLGFRNATYRPGRSVLCIALIASAAFIIVSVDAFRRKGGMQLDRQSGSGGFSLMAESLLPLVHDPNTTTGREALNLATGNPSEELSTVTFTRFRVRPGDDASCLNLYQPRNPKIVAPAGDFIQSNRFSFQNSIASTKEEKDNPWLLLNKEFPDGSIPVMGDANSLAYVLHLGLGEEFVLDQPTGPVRLRVVGALADSIFQSELLMSEKNFLRVFPDQEGFRFFLIDTQGTDDLAQVAATLEERLGDFGFDVIPTNERLENFHRVENTYLSTFQMLGGLGLILGTLGMAAVLLRNVFERRRELALLRAVGYQSPHFTLMVVAENAFLLCCGLITGALCALLAIAPVFLERGGRLPNISLGLLLLAVLISGLAASLVATWAALRSPLLPALRTE